VFTVDRKQGLALLAGLGRDQFTGGYQAFFVGEADGHAGSYGFVGGFESGDADDRTDDEIDVRVRCNTEVSGRAMDDFDFCVETPGFEFAAEEFGVNFAGY
jgi:hypothetical protein